VIFLKNGEMKTRRADISGSFLGIMKKRKDGREEGEKVLNR